MNEIRLHKWRIRLPQSRPLRILLGFALILGGLLGFLPVLGFWMLPLGVMVLSLEIPLVRRWRRRFVVWFRRWWDGRKPARVRNGKARQDAPCRAPEEPSVHRDTQRDNMAP